MARAGRPLSTEQTRLMVALVGALANKGDAVVLSALSSRLGISEDDAHSIIDALIDLGAVSPSFTVAELEGPEGVAIPTTMEGHGKVLRLTASETLAVDAALKRLGSYEGDPLRARILESIASPAVTREDLRRMASHFASPEVSTRILQCSQALYYGSGLRFFYRGVADGESRARRVWPLSIEEDEGAWYLEAIDAHVGAVRTFRLDRMDSIEEDLGVEAAAPIEQPSREVGLLFRSPKMLELLEWPRLRIVGSPDDRPLRARIPYFGGLWLVRRLAACGAAVTVEDADLAAAVRTYAAEQLAQR